MVDADDPVLRVTGERLAIDHRTRTPGRYLTQAALLITLEREPDAIARLVAVQAGTTGPIGLPDEPVGKQHALAVGTVQGNGRGPTGTVARKPERVATGQRLRHDTA